MIQDKDTENNTITVKVNDTDETIELEVEHISHFIQAYKTLEAMYNGERYRGVAYVFTALSAETDAVTSGFGLKSLQVPLLDNLTDWLGKVGIFKRDSDKANKSFNDVLDSGIESFLDSYQTLASKTTFDKGDFKKAVIAYKGKNRRYRKVAVVESLSDTIEERLPKAEAEEAISSALRYLFKPPFMTFNYSASIKSIRATLTKVLSEELLRDAIDDHFANVANDSAYKNKLLSELSLALGLADYSSLLSQLKTNDWTKIKGLEDTLTLYIDGAYGSKIESIMTKSFGPFMQAHAKINASFKAMFKMYKEVYDFEIKEVRKKSANGRVSDAQKLEIIKMLKPLFPAIKGPMSEDGDKDIEVIKTGTASPTSDARELSAAQTKLKSKNNSIVTKKVQHDIAEFEQAISSGSVIPIHFIDAALISFVSNEVREGFVSVHDAIIVRMGLIGSTSSIYNRGVFEVNKKYSFIAEIQKSLIESKKAYETFMSDNNKDFNFSDMRVDYNDPTAIKEEKVKTNPDTEDQQIDEDDDYSITLNDLFDEMSTFSEETEKQRTNLFEEFKTKGFSIAHMASMVSGIFAMDSNGKILKATDNEWENENIVDISDETLAKVTAENDEFEKNHGDMFEEADTFYFDAKRNKIGVPSMSSTDPKLNASYQVFKAHEIRHALTYGWLSDKKNKAEASYLVKSLKFAFKKLKNQDDEKVRMLKDRLSYALEKSTDFEVAAEAIAILSAEPNIREAFLEKFNSKQQSKLSKILDAIKKFLGIATASNVVPIIDTIVSQGSVNTSKDGKGVFSSGLYEGGNTKNELGVRKEIAFKFAKKEALFKKKQNYLKRKYSEYIIIGIRSYKIDKITLNEDESMTVRFKEANGKGDYKIYTFPKNSIISKPTKKDGGKIAVEGLSKIRANMDNITLTKDEIVALRKTFNEEYDAPVIPLEPEKKEKTEEKKEEKTDVVLKETNINDEINLFNYEAFFKNGEPNIESNSAMDGIIPVDNETLNEIKSVIEAEQKKCR
jgi:hypothetical protein